MRVLSVAVAVGLFLSVGCASRPAAAPASGVSDNASLPLQELEAQRLAKGQCALFLWSKADTRRVLMALNVPAIARIRIAGRTLDLPRTEASGQTAFGLTEHQTFVSDGISVSLDLAFDTDKPLLGGVVIREGTLEYRNGAGWSTIAPVGGLIACQP